MISVHVNITLHFLLTVLGAIESSVSFINEKEQMKVSKFLKMLEFSFENCGTGNAFKN